MATKKPTPKPPRRSRKKATKVTPWLPSSRYRYFLPASHSFKDIFRYLVLVVLVVVGVRFTVHYFQTQAAYNRDKVVFALTEQDLDNARDAIVAKLGEPYQVKKTHVCSYVALKFARGPLGCAVAVHLVYGVKDEESGKEMLRSMMDSIVNKNHFQDVNYSSPSNFDKVQESYNADFRSSRGTSCQMMYSVDDLQFFNRVVTQVDKFKPFNGSSPFVAQYSIGCNKYVPRALYEIDKDSL
jgi:hypothetical protein